MAGVSGADEPPLHPRCPAAAHFNVFLLLPMVLDEVARSNVELLTVALDLQDGTLHMAQQLLILQQ